MDWVLHSTPDCIIIHGMTQHSRDLHDRGSEPGKEKGEASGEETRVHLFVRPPSVRFPSLWDAHQHSPSFEAAVAQGLLFDVSALSRPYGLSIPVFLNLELEQDIVARLPGELGGLTPRSRRRVVVAQTATLLSRSVDAIDSDGSLTFLEAVRGRIQIGFDLSLALLADLTDERPRSQGTLLGENRNRQSFEPYALYLSLECDQEGTYGLVLALQSPFSSQRKPVPLPQLGAEEA